MEQAAAHIFNRTQMMENFADDVDLFKQIAALFLSEIPQQWAELATALDADDAARVARAAHKIKGSAASFAAKDVLMAALALERAGKAGQTAALTALGEQLRFQLDRLEAALAAEVA